MKLFVAIAGALVIGSGLVACSGEDPADSEYCTELKSVQSKFSDIQSGETATLEESFDLIHVLADKAPDEVAAEWKLRDDAVTAAEKSLSDAGVTFQDLLTSQETGKMPEGIDESKLTGIATAFKALQGEQFLEAAEKIRTHAKTECKVDL